MKLSLYPTLLLSLLGFIMVNGSPLSAQTTTEPKVKKIPFHGKLQAVDTSAETITIAGKTPRVFHLLPTTKITDGSGSPSTLAAAVVGEDVGGSYTKDAAGTMNLFSVRFGAKTGTKASADAAPAAAAATTAPAATPPPSPTPTALAPAASTPAPAPADTTAMAAPAKVKKQTFSGKVVSVDTTANTIVIHGRADQTFTLTATTKILDATGNPTTLASATTGAKVSGSYSKSPDNTLTVYTLKIGK